ncbi:MAG TPA: FtsX-like permease family protein, partial [Thermoanaerobaculia bacterium]|nr:FtsX-like permease family protein [Thermoanaerobaculia bacterium]
LTLASALIGSVRQPLGFEWKDVWNVSIENDGPPSLEGDAQKRQSIDMVMRELRNMPEIMAVGASMTPPYSMSAMEGTWNVNGKSIFVTQDTVTDGFADVVKLKLISGRWFGPQDDAASYKAVVIDEDLSRAIYGSESPLGKKFDSGSQQEQRVVGVVARYRKTGEFANFGKPVNMVFKRASAVKGDAIPPDLLIRLRPGTGPSFEQTLINRLNEVAPEMNFRIRQLSAMRRFAHRTALFPLVALSMIAGFLLVMVVLGLSGVLWQNVTRRMREIGLRRAIGATGRAVQRQIVAEVAMLTTLAVIVGLLLVTQLPILGLLTLITPGAYIGGIAASLAAIYGLTVLCAMYPGWLASRVQPAHALHYE